MLLIFIFLFFLPFLLWVLTPTKDLAVLLYDKTVPDQQATQHEGLSWFLTHYKYPNQDGLLFDSDQAYLGYHPQAEVQKQELESIPPTVDLLYLADTYGVYKNAEGFLRTTTESNLIWGGTSEQDARVIRNFLNREQSSTVIAEYNSFATPTPSYVQAQLYQLLGTRWTNWTGMYVHDLSIQGETPSWIMDAHQGAWTYEGSGIILYNTNDEVVVLTSKEDLGKEELTFSYTPQGTEQLGLHTSTKYELLFDLTEPLAGTTVLATYNLDLTETGKERLEQYGLPSTFPAIQCKQSANHRSYYLGGNWAYAARNLRFSKLKGMEYVLFAASANTFLFKQYIPLLKVLFAQAAEQKAQTLPSLLQQPYHEGELDITARTKGQKIEVYEQGTWKELFLYGMNLGTAMPGRWFTEFPQDKSLYYHWLEQMGTLGINTVRIYTLLDPQFYDAFALYNRLHPEHPLYLLQEVWPEEEPPGHDYLRKEYQTAFEAEICNVVDAIHGNATIAQRSGRAWGTYTTDVSSYLLGYLVGRELEPHEVEETDKQHASYRFEGSYITTTPHATPTESWLAQSCDYLQRYEAQTYHWQHPVSIVNWPTLDYLTHDSERNEFGIKQNEYNDRTTVNINHLLLGPENKTGLFGSYHIYPNYPDFMNNEPSFAAYEDEQGTFRYGGYLQAFIGEHQSYPAVVAEFGIATGMGNAHYSPDGYHHGGLSEEAQAQGIIRMFEAMQQEGYAGGIIFEWMDEWAKKTWTTEPYMIPYDRHILWHNSIDPEQNYGILAYEAVKPIRSMASEKGGSLIQSYAVRSDASFLSFDLTLSKPLNLEQQQVLFGIDTLYRDRGQLYYLPTLSQTAPSAMEYLVVIDSFNQARLLAVEGASYTAYQFSTAPNVLTSGKFDPMTKLTNKERALGDGTPIPAHYEDASHLRYGPLTGSTNHWTIKGNTLTVRIPWTRINVSDPSSSQVLDDEKLYYSDPLRDQLQTTTTDALVLTALIVDKDGQMVLDSTPPVELILPTWNEPVYSQRLKESYPLLQYYFRTEQEGE